MTELGGTYNYGTIFKIKPDGSDYVKIRDFEGNNDGSNPYGSLYYDGTYLYGMTANGGSGGCHGTIFRIKPDGNGYSILLTLGGTCILEVILQVLLFLIAHISQIPHISMV